MMMKKELWSGLKRFKLAGLYSFDFFCLFAFTYRGSLLEKIEHVGGRTCLVWVPVMSPLSRGASMLNRLQH